MIPRAIIGAIASAIRRRRANGDPLFSQVPLLLHGDAEDGAIVFVDSSGWARPVTRHGNAVISDEHFKFGGSAIYLDGLGSYLSIPASQDFHLPRGDFTMETFFYLDGDTELDANGRRYACLASGNSPDTSALTAWAWGWVITGDGTKTGTGIQFYWTDGAGDFKYIDCPVTISKFAWHHAAVARNAAGVTAYLDGNPVIAITDTIGLSVQETYGEGQPLRIGSNATPGFAYNFRGYLDEVRLTMDASRYSGAFMPPTSAFPEAPIYLVNATGGTVAEHGNYRVHTFTDSGTFTVTQAPEGALLETLLVGGGGGGGFANNGNGYLGGGGGAGRLLHLDSVPAAVGVFPVVIGAGGADPDVREQGGMGGSSSALGFVAPGGGGGGAGGGGSSGGLPERGVGLDGGSGGGGGGNRPGWVPFPAGGAAVAATGGTGLGNPGGDGTQDDSGFAASGGGAGGAGTTGTGATGGAGVAKIITGSSITYAAGGHAGPAAAVVLAPNSGNGGAAGRAGNSGVVVFRYRFRESAPPFPLTLPGLAGWYDAADAETLTVVSGGVSEWRDKSENANHLAQSDPEYRFSVSPAAQNGLDILSVPSGYSAHMTPVSPIVLPPESGYAYVVVSNGAPGNWSIYLMGLSGMYLFDLESFGGGGCYHTVSDGEPQWRMGPAATDGSMNLHGLATSPTGSEVTFNGGVEAQTQKGGLTITSLGNHPSSVYRLRGKVCEIILGTASLDVDTRAAIRSYLCTKWGVA